jgi:hypothetical protein
MEGAIMLSIIQIGLIGADQSHKYFDHRRRMIMENRADELMSEQVKKNVNIIYSRMSSPFSSPLKKLEDIAEEELDKEIDKYVPSPLAEIIKDDVIPVMKDIYNDSNAVKEMNTVYSALKPIFKRRVSKTYDTIKSVIRDVTPSRKRESTHLDDPEFKQFLSEIMLFVYSEYKIQKETPNSHVLKQRQYHDKIIRQMAEVKKSI